MFKIINAMVARSRSIIFASACLAGIAATVGHGMGPMERMIDRQRASIMAKKASGNIVVIAMDEASIAEIHAWPWPRSVHGRMAEQLMKMGAKTVVYDVEFSSPAADPKQDTLFAASLQRAGGRIMLNTYQDKDNKLEASITSPLKEVAKSVSGWVNMDQKTGTITAPYHQTVAGEAVPSMGSALAGVPTTGLRLNGLQPIDWSIVENSIPVLSYADVLAGRTPISAIRGKSVIVGATASSLGDHWSVPNGDRIPGVFLHALAGETLKRGVPQPLGPALPLALAALGLLVALRLRSNVAKYGTLTVAIIATVGSVWIIREHTQYIMDVAPALTLLGIGAALNAVAIIAAVTLTRLTTDISTNLPNMVAMQIASPRGDSTVAVRMRNHLETASVLGQEIQAELLRRARDRIRIAAGSNTIYQVDEHSFAWRTTGNGAELSDTVEGLVALFAAGINIEGRVVDAPITAGIVEDENMDVHASVTAAMLAADHAARQGLPWTRHTDTENDAEWRLTMMGELEAAFEKNDVWVAYQPKLDVESNRITGAEALVRWTHPVRGPIRPDHFIPILEEAGRIERLTLFVLESAIRDFAAFDGLGVAVNLSTRMLGGGKLVETVTRLLNKHGLRADLLTLEITESAAMSGNKGIYELVALREMGVKISIDDYGTGQSTLNYLKQLPATELKIDQSFVRTVNTSRSDNIMIASTIALAHQLDMQVVAEGVETEDVLIALEKLDCNIIQGYFIGKPMPLSEFVRSVASDIVMTKIARSK